MLRRLLLVAPLAAALLAGTQPAAAAPPTTPLPMQSPIDIRLSAVSAVHGLPALQVHYPTSTEVSVTYVRKDDDSPDGCSTRGEEETEEVDVHPGAAWVTYQNVRYDLVQFHFHTRSEHTLNGIHAPLEQHLVHQDAAGRRLVIGVLLFPGAGDEQDRILSALPAECSAEVEIDDFDLRAVLPANMSTLRYQGSLTTAPFSEGVQWFLTVPQTVSRSSIRAFQTLFPEGDSRPTQPLNGRTLVADVSFRI